MVDFAAFRALRFTPRAPRVPGGDRADVSALTAADDDGGYRTAARAWDRWRRDGLVVADPKPGLWALDITAAAGQRQSGLLAALRLDAQVRPHEQVESGLVARRASRLQAVPVDLAPVAVYAARRVQPLADAIDRAAAEPPDVTIVDESDTRFRLWRLRGDADLQAALAGVPVVVADGHHRVAAARRAAPAAAPGTTLAFIMPREPRSRAVHRLLSTDDNAALLSGLEALFTLRPVPDTAALDAALGAAGGPARFGLQLPDGRCWLLVPRRPDRLLAAVPADRPGLWRRLDPVQLTYGVLPHLPGVTARPATSSALDKRPQDGAAAALLRLRPIPTSVITRLAVAGTVMPPKATWFYPKARTGLLLCEAQRVLGAAS